MKTPVRFLLLTLTAGIALGSVAMDKNTRQRYDYFYLEGARQQAAGNYTAAYDLLRYAQRINPQAPETYFALATFDAALQKDSMALKDLQQAIALDPNNTYYLERLAEWYVKNNDLDRSIDAFESLWQHSHENTDALQVLLQLYQQKKDFKKMISVIDRMETEEGLSERLMLMKMQVYEMMGDKKAAYQSLASLVKEHPNDYSYQLMLGNWLVQHDRTKEAYHYFADVLKDNPNNTAALSSMYDYYQAIHAEDKADALLMQLMKSKDTPAATRSLLVRSYVQRNEQAGGDSTKVLKFFNDVLSVPQADQTAYAMKAAYMSIKKMPTDSINAVYRQILRLWPDDAATRVNLLQSLWQEKKYDEVIEMCKPAKEYNPDEMAFYYFSGLAYYQKNEEDSALEAFRQGVTQINDQSNPDIVSDFYAIMGDILVKKGLRKEAYAAYDSCLQWKDDNTGALNNYAYYLSEDSTDLKHAEQMSYKSIKAEPNNATYLDTYAWILFMQHRYPEAKRYIDMARENLDSTENNATVFEHIGDIYAMNHIDSTAWKYWQLAKDSGVVSPTIDYKIKNRKYISPSDYKKLCVRATVKSIRKPQGQFRRRRH